MEINRDNKKSSADSLTCYPVKSTIYTMPSEPSFEGLLQRHSLVDQLNAFSDGIFISDQNGLCLYANDAFCSILGYDYSGALVNMSIIDYAAPEFKEDFRKLFIHSAGDQIVKHEILILPLRRKNGRMVLAEINPSYNYSGNNLIRVIALVRDLTSKNISVELKEKITNFYPGLLRDLPVSVRTNKYLNYGLMGNKGLNKREFQVNVILREIKTGLDRKFRSQENSNLEISLSTPDPDPTRAISTDPEIFTQIIRNLLIYLIKFSRSRQFEFGYHVEKGIYPLFYVKNFFDNIPPDKLKQSYENLKELNHFNTLAASGMFVDLAHTQELVKMLNGRIWAKSGMNEKRVFYFHLGKEQFISHATIHGKESAANQIEWASKNILVVEDLPNNYLYIEAILRKTKAKLFHVTDGKKAVEFVKSDKKVDLILMDIRLPGMDGYEATRRIKQLKPNIPVIAVTAYSFHEEEDKIRKSGINGYVSKPIHSDDLFSTMNEVMQSSPRKSFKLTKWVS